MNKTCSTTVIFDRIEKYIFIKSIKFQSEPPTSECNDINPRGTCQELEQQVDFDAMRSGFCARGIQKKREAATSPQGNVGEKRNINNNYW